MILRVLGALCGPYLNLGRPLRTQGVATENTKSTEKSLAANKRSHWIYVYRCEECAQGAERGSVGCTENTATKEPFTHGGSVRESDTTSLLSIGCFREY